MTKRERVKHEMLVRVSKFGAAHADKFPEGSTGQQAFAALNAAIAQYDLSITAWSDIRHATRGLKDSARTALRFRMANIVRTARAIALEQPGADGRFQPPAQSADVAVLASARGYLDRLEPMKALFVQRGWPDTFVDDFRQATEQFAQALSGRSSDKTGRSDARALTATAIREGLKAARLLDVIVLNTFVGDAIVLGNWKRLRRVDSARVSQAEAPVPDAPAAASQASAEPAADDPLRRAS